MDLILLQFGVFSRRRQDNNTARVVDFEGHLHALFAWIAKQLLKHRDDVIESMVIVVEEHDVVRRLALWTHVRFWCRPCR